MLAIDDLYIRGESKSAVSLKLYPERAVQELEFGRSDAAHWLSNLPTSFRKTAFRGDWFVARVSQNGSILKELPKSKIICRLLAIRSSLRRKKATPELTAQVFALIRELSARCLGKRHYDVQVYAAWVMLNGMVAEMETGEGKTLAVSLAAATSAISGTAVHVLTVNDYLAARDAKALMPLYTSLGLSVGVVTADLGPKERRAAYACDITYCTARELAFDYLRDRMVFDSSTSDITRYIDKLYGQYSRSRRLLLRGLEFAIVDECDSILIDEASTPLVLAGSSHTDSNNGIYLNALKLARRLQAGLHFTTQIRARKVKLTATGAERVSKLLLNAENSSTELPDSASIVVTALCALHLYKIDRDYLVRDNKVQIIDGNTGRTKCDHSWEQGLHQMIEVKEGCPISAGKQTLSRISFQRLFRRYLSISGTTGTASEVSRELKRVYGLGVISIPTHQPVLRKYLKEQVFSNEQDKFDAIVRRVAVIHKTGRPVLIATRTVEASERLSFRLREKRLKHRLLSASQDKNEAETIARAGDKYSITVATNMAGRGTDIALSREVTNLGGLHVIATERHEARRIDRQLYGRCARQGNPGSCELFSSATDHLVEVYCPPWIAGLLTFRLCQTAHVRKILIPILGQIAQWRSERYQSELRSDVLRSDENLAANMGFAGPPE